METQELKETKDETIKRLADENLKLREYVKALEVENDNRDKVLEQRERELQSINFALLITENIMSSAASMLDDQRKALGEIST